MNSIYVARHNFVAFFIVATCMAMAGDAWAITTVYSDRHSWEAAVANNFLTENFNSIPAGALSLGLNDAGLIDIRVNNIVGQITFTGSQFTGETDAPGGQTHDFVFPSPVIGFAGDWSGTTGNSLLVTMLGGDTVLFADYLAAPGSGFLGFVSDTPFTEAHMTDQGISGNELYNVDNLSFAPIPEPASLGMASIGLLWLVSLLRGARVRRV
jgi:hypothetical protein